jgi:hypothetical protein
MAWEAEEAGAEREQQLVLGVSLVRCLHSPGRDTAPTTVYRSSGRAAVTGSRGGCVVIKTVRGGGSRHFKMPSLVRSAMLSMSA